MTSKVRDWIQSRASRITDPAIHFAPDLPAKPLRAACRAFARGSQGDEALLLIDTGARSRWSAPTGLLLTSSNIYAQAEGEPPFRLPIAELRDVLLSERGSSNEQIGGLPSSQSSCSVYLNDRLAFVLRPNRPRELLDELRQLFRGLTIVCNPEVGLGESLVVRICWACGELTLRPLLVIARSEPDPNGEFPLGREPHSALMRCAAACGGVQLDHRASSRDGAAYAFDAADSAVLLEITASCPDHLSGACPCPVHGALRSLPPFPQDVDRYPDPCMYDLPKLHVEAVEGLPRIRLRSGHVQTCRASGHPKAEGDLRSGVPAGRWRLWHENGQLKSEGDYEDGRRSGRWQQWNEHGALRCDEFYQNGERAKTLWRPDAEIAEALDTRSCLACSSSRLAVLIVLDRSGIPPEREGHEIVYAHMVLVRCLECGAGQVDVRKHDCFDFEDVYEQGSAYALDAASAATLAEAVKACPHPLSESCRCAVHRSLREGAKSLPGDMDRDFAHVQCLEVVARANGVPALRPRSGWFQTVYAGGGKRAEGTLVDGHAEGRCTAWHRTGHKAAEGVLHRSLREGPWIEWNQQGEIIFERAYKDGYTI